MNIVEPNQIPSTLWEIELDESGLNDQQKRFISFFKSKFSETRKTHYMQIAHSTHELKVKNKFEKGIVPELLQTFIWFELDKFLPIVTIRYIVNTIDLSTLLTIVDILSDKQQHYVTNILNRFTK